MSPAPPLLALDVAGTGGLLVQGRPPYLQLLLGTSIFLGGLWAPSVSETGSNRTGEGSQRNPYLQGADVLGEKG